MIMQGGYMDLMMEQIRNSQGESVSELGNEMQSALCTQNETMNKNLLVAPCETYTQMILEEDSTLANADISKVKCGGVGENNSNIHFIT
jgi:hypothetical protein